MILRPGITIKKENENEKIFIIEDSNVHWVRQGTDELLCSVPEGWVSEIVAITIREYKGFGFETMGISVGKANTDFCPLQPPADKIITEYEAKARFDAGKIIYNGSVYKLIN